jgi:hypothetical protein
MTVGTSQRMIIVTCPRISTATAPVHSITFENDIPDRSHRRKIRLSGF